MPKRGLPSIQPQIASVFRDVSCGSRGRGVQRPGANRPWLASGLNGADGMMKFWLQVAQRAVPRAMAVGAALVIAGCAQNQPKQAVGLTLASADIAQLEPVAEPVTVKAAPSRPRLARVKGVRKVGKPYKIAGKWYHPRVDATYNAVGTASWYGPGFHGKKTANGELYDQWALTAAHPTLPMPSIVEVTNLENGRTVMVRVNDRGPFAHGREIDMSRYAAQLLGFEGQGTAKVRVRFVKPAPLEHDDSFERRHLVSQPWARTAALGSVRPRGVTRAASAPSPVGPGLRGASLPVSAAVGTTLAQRFSLQTTPGAGVTAGR